MKYINSQVFESFFFFLAAVQPIFSVTDDLSDKLFEWISKFKSNIGKPSNSNNDAPRSSLQVLLMRTVLNYFSKVFPVISHVVVSCPRQLDITSFLGRALEISFGSLYLPYISALAAKAIDKLTGSNTIGFHLDWVGKSVHQLLLSSVEIALKVQVVRSYTRVVAVCTLEERLPGRIADLLDGFPGIDFRSCDPRTALDALKIVSVVGKTLQVRAPRLRSPVWEEGVGLEMQLWVKSVVVTCFQRFHLEYEFMEVRFVVAFKLRKGYHGNGEVCYFATL